MMATHEADQGHEVFEVIRRSEEAVLGAGRKWATAVTDAMPVELPMVREVVKGAFDLSERVLTAQREFAHSLLHVTRPPVQARAKKAAPSTTAVKRTRPTHKAV